MSDSEEKYNAQWLKGFKDSTFLESYEDQANFLNSITVHGKPIMKVSAEYLSVIDERDGFRSRKK